MALADNFFRHEYGRLVALLSHRVGLQHLCAVEDAVQGALAAAVDTWPRTGTPEHPSAWLFRAASNHLTSELRRDAQRSRLAQRYLAESQVPLQEEGAVALASEISDDMLPMLFACCDEALPMQAQLVLALKVLCGFDVREISERLFVSEANVYKRLTRARKRLREVDFALTECSAMQLAARLPAVQTILYVLFTEGYLSSHAEVAIRQELCDEGLRLAEALAQHAVGATPETFALLALMHLHVARTPARQDGSGGLLLLEEQDRTLWDQRHIGIGMRWLARSAEGPVFSRFHAEAGIAAEHCLSPSFAQTRWDRIVANYQLLDQLAPSPLHSLNRAVALAEWRGPEAGLQVLEALSPPSWLSVSYLWAAVLADLYRRAGQHERAARHRSAAIERAPSDWLRAALEKRLG